MNVINEHLEVSCTLLLEDIGRYNASVGGLNTEPSTSESNTLLDTDLFWHFLCFYDREEGMGDRGEDTQHRTAGRIRSRVAAIRTGPIWYALYPLSQ